MVRFLDGPAAGVMLELRRAPLFLRVVGDTRGLGEWDALDQLGDTPAADETITVYRRAGKAGWIHVCRRGKGSRSGGTFATAEYRLHAEQPSDEIARSQAKWRSWCELEWDRLKALEAEAVA